MPDRRYFVFLVNTPSRPARGSAHCKGSSGVPMSRKLSTGHASGAKRLDHWIRSGCGSRVRKAWPWYSVIHSPFGGVSLSVGPSEPSAESAMIDGQAQRSVCVVTMGVGVPVETEKQEILSTNTAPVPPGALTWMKLEVPVAVK